MKVTESLKQERIRKQIIQDQELYELKKKLFLSLISSVEVIDNMSILSFSFSLRGGGGRDILVKDQKNVFMYAITSTGF